MFQRSTSITFSYCLQQIKHKSFFKKNGINYHGYPLILYSRCAHAFALSCLFESFTAHNSLQILFKATNSLPILEEILPKMLSKYLLLAVRLLSLTSNVGAVDANELGEAEKRDFLDDVILADLEKRDDVTYVITDMVTVTSETDIIVSFAGPYDACGTSSMHIVTTS